MMPEFLRRASLRLGVLLAALSLEVAFPLAPTAHAAPGDEEARKALSLSDVERQSAQSEEYRRLAEAKRMESIERLKELLGATTDGDRKAEMMLRLADLYFEQGRSDYMVEMEAYQVKYDQCFNTAKDPEACDSIEPENASSNGWYGKCVKLYDAVIRSYPRFEKTDQATFYLGMTHQEMKKPEDALSAFQKLVKLYPDSGYVPDAYLMIGDYYFEKNEAFPALKAYLKASSYKESARYPYAMYKLAWSYYNVEEYAKAIDTMKAVIAYSMQNTSEANRAIKLEEEALKDLVRFFADAGELDEAYEYFTKLGRKELIRSMLKRLASLYFEQGKFEQSVETYRRLIAETPSSPENPGYQEEIIACYRKMSQKPRVLEEIRRLRDDYGRQSAWWRANASSPDAQKSADDTIEKALRRTATDFNLEARDLQKARHPSSGQAFEAAVEAYYVYLGDYGKNPSSYNVHYDFGELLWMLKRYEEAYREYVTVVEMDPKGQHSRFCAESAIFAAEEMVKKEGGGAIQPKTTVKVTKDVQPVPLSEWEQKLVAACKKYSDLYPGDSKVEVAIYKSAFLLYNRYHFAEAAEQFRSVIARWPNSQNAEYSANLILDALAIREEYVPLRDTARAFYEQKELGSAAFKKEMYDIWSRSSFVVIERDFERTQDYGATADAFVAFAAQFPDFEKVDTGLNNAAFYYYKADRVADSMKVRTTLVEDPKFAGKTKYYYAQVAALGFDWERLADFEQAARYYDKLVELYPAERPKVEKAGGDLAALDQQAADALFTSAVFRTALGDWKGGIDRYRKFLTLFPKDARATEVRLAVGKVYEDNAQTTDAERSFLDFYTKDAKDAPAEFTYYARLHHGRALIAQAKVADGRKVYAASVDLYQKAVAKGLEPGPYTNYVAEMMFELTKDAAAAYEKLEIKGAGTRSQRTEDKAFADSLKRKTTALVELEKAYKAIIETGSGPFGLASLVGLGRAYENMGATLGKSPCPFYLTEDQCEIYRMTLADRAYTQVEKAVEAYKLALDKTYELRLYNDDAAFATRRLGELRPDDFPGLAETLPQGGLTAETSREFPLENTIGELDPSLVAPAPAEETSGKKKKPKKAKKRGNTIVLAEDQANDPRANFQAGLDSLAPDKKGGANLPAAYDFFVKAANLGGSRNAMFNAGWVAEKLNRLADAEKHLRDAYAKDAAYTPAVFSLVRVLDRLGKASDVVTLIEGYLARTPDDLGLRGQYMEALVKAGRFDDAVAVGQGILRKDASNAAVYRNLSSLYLKKGQLEMARITGDKALELDDKDANTYNNLGVVSLRNGDVRGAIERFETARKLDGEHFEASTNLGLIALDAGDYGLGKTCFEAATKRNPASYVARVGLAVALRGTGDTKGADAVYQALIKESPDQDLAFFDGAALHERYTKDFAAALKYLEAYKAARVGKVGPNDPVFAKITAVQDAQAKEEERKRLEAERIKAEEERKKRAQELLAGMQKTIDEITARLDRSRVCVGEGVAGELDMWVATATETVGAQDTDMVLEVQSMLKDYYLPMLEEGETAGGCGATAPAPVETPAPAAPADGAPAPAQPAPDAAPAPEAVPG